MAATVIRNFIAKALFKKQGAIANNKAVEFSANALENRLKNFGIDPNAITSEKELNQILGLVKQAEDRAFQQRFGDMLAGSKFDKQADVLDMTGKKIDPRSKIMGGQQAETEAEIAARMSKENKEAAQRIKNKNMVKDAVDNASPGFVKGDRKYNAQLVADDLAEKKFGKDFYDLDQRQQIDLYDEALDGLSVDPEDMAQGGRAGYKFGIGPLFSFLNKKSPMKAYMDYLKSIKDRVKAGKEAEVAGEVIPVAATGALITNQVKKKLKAMNEEQKKEFKKDMEKKADGGRIGYKNGPNELTAKQIKRLDRENLISKINEVVNVQASGSKSGKRQIKGAPDGITIDNESINAIIKADIPISQKINLIAEYKYGKGRNKIEDKGQEIFLDEGGFKNRNVGLGFNQDGEGISGSIMRNFETGDDDFEIRFLKRFANGGRIGFDKGTMPKSERWMRDYFFSGKGGYDDRMSYQEFALGPGQELFKRFNKKNGGVMYGKYAKQILSS